jgi:hypothetical protein
MSSERVGRIIVSVGLCVALWPGVLVAASTPYTTRAQWLAAVGAGAPLTTVDFEELPVSNNGVYQLSSKGVRFTLIGTSSNGNGLFIRPPAAPGYGSPTGRHLLAANDNFYRGAVGITFPSGVMAFGLDLYTYCPSCGPINLNVRVFTVEGVFDTTVTSASTSFLGIVSTSPISGVNLQGSYVVLDNLTFHRTGIPPCVPVLPEPPIASVPYGGGSGSMPVSFAVADPRTCFWTAQPPNERVTVSPQSGQGDGLITFNVTANDTGVRQRFPVVVRQDAGDNAPSAVFTIVQPTSGIPQLSVSADEGFGDVVVGAEDTKSVFVENVGSVAVTIAANDCRSDGFRVDQIPDPTLEPGDGVWVDVVFKPPSAGAHRCVLSFSPDGEATALLTGAGIAATNGLGASQDARTYSAGRTMTLTVTLTPGSAPVDAYVVAQLPTGGFLSLQLDGRLVPGIVPIARRFVPFAHQGTLARHTFTGAEPRGTYTWYSVLTQPGTLTFVSPLHESQFVVR